MLGTSLIVAGLLLLWAQHAFILRGWHSRHWPPTRAKIVARKLYEGLPGRIIFKQTHSIYTYEYSVTGHTYTTTDYSCAGGLDPAETAWVVGDHTTVHYDPKSPSRAVVKTGVRPITVVPGIALVLAGVYSLLASK